MVIQRIIIAPFRLIFHVCTVIANLLYSKFVIGSRARARPPRGFDFRRKFQYANPAGQTYFILTFALLLFFVFFLFFPPILSYYSLQLFPPVAKTSIFYSAGHTFSIRSLLGFFFFLFSGKYTKYTFEV